MRVRISAPGADLISEVLSHLKGRGRDYSDSLVVFPGQRPSHFLRRRLARQIGTSLIPPAIFSIDHFVDFICEKFGFVRKLEMIDAIALLYEIHERDPKRLGGSEYTAPDRFFPLGLKIYRDIEELAIEGIKSDQLKQIGACISDTFPQKAEERIETIIYYYEEFYKKVAALGFSTRSNRYRFASERVERAHLERFDPILLAGFFALTASEKVLFRRLLSWDNTLLLFQQGVGLEEALKALGIPDEIAPPIESRPEIHFYGSPDAHGQVLALSQVLDARRAEGNPPDENTVIVLPSSDILFPLLRQGLSHLAEDAFNVSLGYPLGRTPVFGLFNSLMELVASLDGDRVYIPDYLKFVLHPYTKNIYFRRNSEVTRMLFHTLEEELLRERTKTFTTLEEIEGKEALFSKVAQKVGHIEAGTTEEDLREHLRKIHRITIASFLSFQDISDFAKKSMDLLLFLFHGSPAKLHPLFHPFSESLMAALDLLPRSLMRELSFRDRASYFLFLQKYVATCHVPFPGTPLKGLQVLGALETRNLKFSSVFVLDANEEILPETKKDDSLIPFRAREVLGLPTYVDRDRLTAYYFDILLSGAKDVHLFFIENDQAERSRFVEKLLWERQKRDKSTDVKGYIRSIQYRVTLENKAPEPIGKTEEVVAYLKELTYSADALDRYLNCPLQFYYASVLGMRRKEEIAGEIERDELGSFIHTVLRDYFSKRTGRTLKEIDLSREEMGSLIEDRFKEKYGGNSSGALYLLKRQIKRHLADFLEDYCVASIKESAVSILSCEKDIRIRLHGFNLAGRIDRIEQRDDRVVIIDYKTGANPSYLRIDAKRLDLDVRNSWGKAIGSLQLPFYILLYGETERRPMESLEALYLLLGRSRIGKEIELPLFGADPPAEAFAPLRAVIFKVLQEIVDPSTPFQRTADMKRTCPRCDYQHICATQWILR